jgi:hypothetical protein
VVEAIGSGSVPWYEARDAFLAAPPQTRASLVRGVIEFARAFVATPAFAASWAALRKDHEPAPPKDEGAVAADLAAQRREAEQNVAEMRRQAAAQPAEMRAAMEQAAQALEMQIRAMDSPEMKAQMALGAQGMAASERARYEEERRAFETGYPADPGVLVARRLRAFLDGCADVDFDAGLVEIDGRKRFELTRYEAKTAEWKLCYRAGRAAVEAARAGATAWLRDLEKKARTR